jgi:hypothetical protein
MLNFTVNREIEPIGQNAICNFALHKCGWPI